MKRKLLGSGVEDISFVNKVSGKRMILYIYRTGEIIYHEAIVYINTVLSSDSTLQVTLPKEKDLITEYIPASTVTVDFVAYKKFKLGSISDVFQFGVSRYWKNIRSKKDTQITYKVSWEPNTLILKKGEPPYSINVTDDVIDLPIGNSLITVSIPTNLMKIVFKSVKKFILESRNKFRMDKVYNNEHTFDCSMGKNETVFEFQIIWAETRLFLINEEHDREVEDMLFNQYNETLEKDDFIFSLYWKNSLFNNVWIRSLITKKIGAKNVLLSKINRGVKHIKFVFTENIKFKSAICEIKAKDDWSMLKFFYKWPVIFE